MMEFWPVATTFPAASLSSSREKKTNKFEYVIPGSGVTPEFVTFMPAG
jgi:hypothetical protein